jgi:simple sugar transport system permease protein
MSKAELLNLLLASLAFATPILLAALGELIAERSGVLNIGLEGMMLSGAWAGAAFSYSTRSPLAGVVAAALAGVLLAAIFALLVLRYKAEAIVAGTGLNLLALGATGVAHRAMIAKHGSYESATLPMWFFFALSVVLIPALWWLLTKTRPGLQLRAAGEYPLAAEASGASVMKLRWVSTLFNGALCGMAGAFLSMSHTDSFAENMTAGRGFIALAIVIFGRWSPFGALAAALLFAAANAAQFGLQAKISTQYYPLLLALPYALTILTLAGFAGKSRAPAALGEAEAAR